jgi:hypothetical protein
MPRGEALSGKETTDGSGERNSHPCFMAATADNVVGKSGAVAMCRAQRSTRPLDHVSAQLESLLTTAVNG